MWSLVISGTSSTSVIPLDGEKLLSALPQPGYTVKGNSDEYFECLKTGKNVGPLGLGLSVL